MREIEVRAWDNHKKKMFNYEFLCDLPSNYMVMELMQYTGKKDRNGVKIYEGDFLQLGENIMGIKWGSVTGIGYGFMWEGVQGKHLFVESITGFIDEYEVIGNIYENPELLDL